MWGSGTKDRHQQRVEDLLQEQNNLLREFIQIATGRSAQTPKLRASLPDGFKPRTAKDVTIVTRETLLKQQHQEEQDRLQQEHTNEPLGRS